MQETVTDALAYWDSLSLPTRHVMYDSWWYWKECGGGISNTWLNCKGALELWEPRNDVFPSGFDFKVPHPLVLHNRWFSANNNSYIKDLGFAVRAVLRSVARPRAPLLHPLAPRRTLSSPSRRSTSPSPSDRTSSLTSCPKRRRGGW